MGNSHNQPHQKSHSTRHTTIDEKFAGIADSVSEGMGKWWVTTTAFILLSAWTIFCAVTQGPGWWYGAFYNFPTNLITTIAELFIGFLLAAATNRVERRNHEQMRRIEQLEKKVAHSIDNGVHGHLSEQDGKILQLLEKVEHQEQELISRTNNLIDLIERMKAEKRNE